MIKHWQIQSNPMMQSDLGFLSWSEHHTFVQTIGWIIGNEHDKYNNYTS